MSVWNNFIPAHGNLLEIISKLFHNLIAAHEYFPAHSVSLEVILAAEIILFQFQVWLHVK